MNLSQEERQRISDAVRSVENRTSGEIVCVLAQSSSGATVIPLLIASLTALALPWLLVALTPMAVYRILALQIALFAGLLIFLSVPRVRSRLMPARMRREMGYRAAREQFVARGLERKQDRCAILIFVSLAERYARIIADDGIAARVPQSQWQAAVNALVEHVREDRVVEGFVAAIELCGAELTAHFPLQGEKREELPDRIYLI